MSVSTTWALLLTIGLLYIIKSSAQTLPGPPCPEGENATCCACVSTPGCSWFSPPGEDEHSRPYCAQSPYLQGSEPEWAQGDDKQHIFPAQKSHIRIRRDEPLSFNSQRPRFVRPQRMFVKVAVGARAELPFQISPGTANSRLTIRGPPGNADGRVEFSLHRTEPDSCEMSFRKLAPRRGRTRDGRPAGREVRSTRSRVMRQEQDIVELVGRTHQDERMDATQRVSIRRTKRSSTRLARQTGRSRNAGRRRTTESAGSSWSNRQGQSSTGSRRRGSSGRRGSSVSGVQNTISRNHETRTRQSSRGNVQAGQRVRAQSVRRVQGARRIQPGQRMSVGQSTPVGQPLRNRNAGRALGINNQGGPYPRRQTYVCRSAGPGMASSLVLAIDVKRCLERPMHVRVMVKGRGGRSTLRVTVNSLCQCPTCLESEVTSNEPSRATSEVDANFTVELSSENIQGSPVLTRVCNDDLDNLQECQAPSMVNYLSPKAMLCLRRGVNDVCVNPAPARNTSNGNANTHSDYSGESCSGRGVCLCGECACSARHELYPESRYSGTHCECDNFSCPRQLYNNAICGGPQRGVCQCGQCVCYPGFRGEVCEESTYLSACVDYSNTTTSGTGPEPCSGRGICRDEQCECPLPYSGMFCECDNEACSRHDGLLCGGERGRCACGECVCVPGYTGEACEVEDGRRRLEEQAWGGPPSSCTHHQGESVDGVGEVAGLQVCSGRGVCVGGQCQCNPPYTGALCEMCDSC